MSDTVSVRLPDAISRTLSDWPNHPVIAELPRAVLVVGAEVHSPHGCALDPDAACEMGSAFAAAALCAGHRPDIATDDDGELLVVASPISTPSWGDPGWAYFSYGSGYVAARPSAESTGDSTQIPCGTGETMSAEHAWSDGLSLIAAGRYAIAAEVAA